MPDYYYAKITVPALTAGVLMLDDGDDCGLSDLFLGGDSLWTSRGPNVSLSTELHVSAHTSADSAANTARKDAMKAHDAAADAEGDTANDEAYLRRTPLSTASQRLRTQRPDALEADATTPTEDRHHGRHRPTPYDLAEYNSDGRPHRRHRCRHAMPLIAALRLLRTPTRKIEDGTANGTLQAR